MPDETTKPSGDIVGGREGQALSSETWDRIKAFYQEGLELDPCERGAWLDAQCADTFIRDEVQELWENTNDDTLRLKGFSIISSEAETQPGLNDSADFPAGLPKVIGSYHLQSLIAVGGMGVVYKAEQKSASLNRVVALKVLETKLLTKEYRKRFSGEQQALFLMSHRYIASVYDANVTGNGLPYYTMEYLDGLPINQYCDSRGLTIKQRISLFMKVCEGIQHAHQKGVIHRDIKPSNILVTEEEGVAVPKIIDFGIAKFLDDSKLENPMETRIGMVVGTPSYMSPEQASGNARDNVDTRTDIYSLGVMLYELLVGVLPLDVKIKRAVDLSEMGRVVREEEPIRPSERLGTEELVAEKAARGRAVNPNELRRMIQGDLDWIVMKALEKDPARRYAGCNAFIEDLQAFLSDLPVSARPPGLGYQLGKFIKRNKARVIAAAVVVLVTISAAVVVFRQQQISKERIQREAEKLRTVNDYLVGILRSGRNGPKTRVQEILDTAAKTLPNEPELRSAFEASLAKSYNALGMNDLAMMHSKNAYEIAVTEFGESHPDTIEIAMNLATQLGDDNRKQEAEQMFRQTIAILSKTAGERSPQYFKGLHGLARSLFDQGKESEVVESMLLKALHGQWEVLGEHSETLATQYTYGLILTARGRYEEAVGLHRKTVASGKRLFGESHPVTLRFMNSLGIALYRIGHYEEAEAVLRESYTLSEDLLGVSQSVTGAALTGLTMVIRSQGRYQEAVDLLWPVVSNAGLDQNQVNMIRLRNVLAGVLMLLGEYEKAESVARTTVDLSLAKYGQTSRRTVIYMSTLGEILREMGKTSEAYELAQKILSIALADPDTHYPKTANYHSLMGLCLIDMKRFSEAESYLLESHQIFSDVQNVPELADIKKELIRLYQVWP